VEDKTDHSTQLAKHEYYGIENITQEYVDAISNRHTRLMLPNNWQENPEKIKKMLNETAKHDKIRGNDWKKTFPEVAEFYSRYL
jgi:hypothetical protein